MPDKAYPATFFYDDIEKANQYWKRFEKDDNIVLSCGEKLKVLNDVFEQISIHNCVLILIWDIVKDRFVYAIDKRNVVGYEMSLYLADNGIHFSRSNLPPDFNTAARLMQLKALEYMVQYKAKELNKIIVNIDGQYKKCNGDYFHFLQQSMIIEFNPNGSPALFLSYIHDITHFKKRESANLVITAPDDIKMWNFNFDNCCLELIRPVSRQEKKVLSYLAKGNSSKAIAKELFISPHTVDTHRRNLLRRTNCLDTSGLVTYAKLVGLF